MKRFMHGCVALMLILATPVLARERAISQTDTRADFLPEGIAWDAPRERFLLGSVRLKRIDTVDVRDGHAPRFADASGSVLGLQVDNSTRTLWIT